MYGVRIKKNLKHYVNPFATKCPDMSCSFLAANGNGMRKYLKDATASRPMNVRSATICSGLPVLWARTYRTHTQMKRQEITNNNREYVGKDEP